MLTPAEINTILTNLYYNESNLTAYTSKANIFKFAKLRDPRISKQIVNKWFMQQETYTVHKPVPKKYLRTKTIQVSPLKQVQIDLLDMQKYKGANNEYKYICFIIDVFARRAWAYKFKKKQEPKWR